MRRNWRWAIRTRHKADSVPRGKNSKWIGTFSKDRAETWRQRSARGGPSRRRVTGSEKYLSWRRRRAPANRNPLSTSSSLASPVSQLRLSLSTAASSHFDISPIMSLLLQPPSPSPIFLLLIFFRLNEQTLVLILFIFALSLCWGLIWIWGWWVWSFLKKTGFLVRWHDINHQMGIWRVNRQEVDQSWSERSWIGSGFSFLINAY